MRCLLLGLLLTFGASLFATSQYVVITPTGSYTMQRLENQTLNLNHDPEPGTCNVGAGSYYQKWYYYNSGQIGQKCEIGKLNGKIHYFVAQTLNNPCIQVFTDDAVNNATPDWTYSL